MEETSNISRDEDSSTVRIDNTTGNDNENISNSSDNPRSGDLDNYLNSKINVSNCVDITKNFNFWNVCNFFFGYNC